MTRTLLALTLAACTVTTTTKATDDTGDTAAETDSADGTDTETALGTGLDDTDTDTDTDLPLPTWTVSGKTLCVTGVDGDGNTLYGDPSFPRDIRVIPGRGIECAPLMGTDCMYTNAYHTYLARTDVASDGSFSLTFEAEDLDGLWLFSDEAVRDGLGNCGNGLQYTERPLDEIEGEGGLTDLTVPVYRIFH